jgi:hypothetical protein
MCVEAHKLSVIRFSTSDLLRLRQVAHVVYAHMPVGRAHDDAVRAHLRRPSHPTPTQAPRTQDDGGGGGCGEGEEADRRRRQVEAEYQVGGGGETASAGDRAREPFDRRREEGVARGLTERVREGSDRMAMHAERRESHEPPW